MKDFSNSHLLFAQASPVKGNTTTQTTAPQEGTPKAKSPSPFSFQLLLPLALIFVIYFVLLRPQQKREKNRQSMLQVLKKGDKVVTRGGIRGTVMSIKKEDSVVVLEIASKVHVDVDKNAIDDVYNTPKSDKR